MAGIAFSPLAKVYSGNGAAKKRVRRACGPAEDQGAESHIHPWARRQNDRRATALHALQGHRTQKNG